MSLVACATAASFALILAACACAGEVVTVTQLGARPDDGADDTQAVRAAIQLCRQKPGSVLRFPKGRYDFRGRSISARVSSGKRSCSMRALQG